MRRSVITVALLIMLLVLAACGGGGDDSDDQTANGSDAGGDPTAVDAGGDPTAAGDTEGSDTGGSDAGDTGGSDAGAPTGEPTLQMAPVVGVLGTPAATPEVEFDPEDLGNDPANAEPFATGFEYIYFQQEGGGQDINIVIEVYADGRVVRDGVELPVPAESIQQLASQIDTVDFFNVIATFLGPPPDENDYRYLLFVRSEDQERSIRAQDGFTPLEIQQLFSAIRGISDDARRVAGA